MQFFETLIALLCSNGSRSAKRKAWNSKYIMRRIYNSQSKLNVSVTDVATGERHTLSREDLSANDWEIIEEQ